MYTPGSTAGLPVSILKSFAAPGPAIAEDPQLLREQVNGTATALLGLFGMQADPVQSREHILLALNQGQDATAFRGRMVIPGALGIVQPAG